MKPTDVLRAAGWARELLQALLPQRRRRPPLPPAEYPPSIKPPAPDEHTRRTRKP